MPDRQTRVLGGNGTSVQAFTLDPGLLQYVQSVFVTVDNSAGADIQPTLTVQTNNGVDFAKKQQGRSIPAGDSGSATWALRLDDETDAASTSGLPWAFNVFATPPAGFLDPSVWQQGGTPRAMNPAGPSSAGFTFNLPANTTIGVLVENYDTASHDFRLAQGILQQIGATNREIVQGNAVTIAGGSSDVLTWDTVITGSTALLNLTTPSIPKVVGTAVYALAVAVQVSP